MRSRFGGKVVQWRVKEGRGCRLHLSLVIRKIPSWETFPGAFLSHPTTLLMVESSEESCSLTPASKEVRATSATLRGRTGTLAVHSVWMLQTHYHSSSHAGNLGRVDYISDFEYDLFIRPDTCNPRYANCLCSAAVASHSSYTLGIVSGSTLLCRMSAQTR